MSKDLDELQIIINQQAILQGKVGVLLTINALFISFIITLAVLFSLWILFFLFFSIISLIINIYIVYPNFNSGPKTKYFYDYANMNQKEIKKFINSKEYDFNIYEQIRINSLILKDKYNYFKKSLIIQFLFLPYIFELINNKKTQEKK